MSVMSYGSIFNQNCKNCCFIILDIFLALIREKVGGGGAKAFFIKFKNKQIHMVKI